MTAALVTLAVLAGVGGLTAVMVLASGDVSIADDAPGRVSLPADGHVP
jgi:hypothetical protein